MKKKLDPKLINRKLRNYVHGLHDCAMQKERGSRNADYLRGYKHATTLLLQAGGLEARRLCEGVPPDELAVSLMRTVKVDPLTGRKERL